MHTIKVTVEGGLITEISGIPPGVEIEVRDHDSDTGESGFSLWQGEECPAPREGQTPFRDWITQYAQQVFPLYQAEDFDDYDQEYDAHLRRLHETVSEQPDLLDAAPDLLAACEKMLQITGGSAVWQGETHQALKLVEAAVAKAKAGTP